MPGGQGRPVITARVQGDDRILQLRQGIGAVRINQRTNEFARCPG